MSGGMAPEMEAALLLLDKSARQLGIWGHAWAEAEWEYRVALGKKMEEGHEKGVPAAILGDVCRGKVGPLGLARDRARAEYEAAKAMIGLYTLRIQVLGREVRGG